jgi:type IV pilus assembly protein PilA
VAILCGLGAAIWYATRANDSDTPAAAEAVATDALMNVRAALSQYAMSHGDQYPATLEPLGARAAMPVQDAQIGGYALEYRALPSEDGKIHGFTLLGQPKSANGHSFYLDQSGVLRATEASRPARADDPPAWGGGLGVWPTPLADSLEMSCELLSWGDDVMTDTNQERGFSLMELLIVVAVILAITAIAVPNLFRSKMAANEASAVGSLKAVNGSCVTYASTWNVGYPVALRYLGPGTPTSSTGAGMIDSLLAAGAKSGYTFAYVSGAPSGGQVRTYTLRANPTVPNKTGQRYFFTDQSGVIRQNLGGVATSSSTPIK